MILASCRFNQQDITKHPYLTRDMSTEIVIRALETTLFIFVNN